MAATAQINGQTASKQDLSALAAALLSDHYDPAITALPGAMTARIAGAGDDRVHRRVPASSRRPDPEGCGAVANKIQNIVRTSLDLAKRC